MGARESGDAQPQVTRQVRVTPAARVDSVEAADRLAEESASTAERFTAELQKVYDTVSEYPNIYAVVRHRVHRATLKSFPYGVYYVVHRRDIVVIAVIHHARDDSAWTSRNW